MANLEFKEPTVAGKLAIRRQLEKVDMREIGKSIMIIPTDLAIEVCQHCYGIDLDGFVRLKEEEISQMAIEAISKLFFNGELDKKK